MAFVTGAAAGIGRAIADTFAAVMVSDRDATAAKSVAAEIAAHGGRAAGIACDMTRDEDLVELVNQTVQSFGKLTILISKAGGGGPKPFDMPMTDFRRV